MLPTDNNLISQRAGYWWRLSVWWLRIC